MARRLGASAEQLTALERRDYSGIEPAWRDALVYADAITPTGGRADEALFASLASEWNAAQLVEITSVIGLFSYFNRFAEALDIPPTQ